MTARHTGGRHGAQYERTRDAEDVFKHELEYFEHAFSDLNTNGKLTGKLYKQMRDAGLSLAFIKTHDLPVADKQDKEWNEFRSAIIQILELNPEKNLQSQRYDLETLGNRLGKAGLARIKRLLSIYLELLSLKYPQEFPQFAPVPVIAKSSHTTRWDTYQQRRREAEEVDRNLTQRFQETLGIAQNLGVETLQIEQKYARRYSLMFRLKEVKIVEILEILKASEIRRTQQYYRTDLRLAGIVALLMLQNHSPQEIRETIQSIDPHRGKVDLNALVQTVQLEILRKRTGVKSRFK